MQAALAAHGPARVLVGVDVRDGAVATHGWLEASAVSAPEALTQLRARGVERFAFTDIDHDGMLDGPDLAAVESAARAVGDGELIVSGGIGTTRAPARRWPRLRAERALDGDRGRDRRQGAVRGTLHGRPGEGGALGLSAATVSACTTSA